MLNIQVILFSFHVQWCIVVMASSHLRGSCSLWRSSAWSGHRFIVWVQVCRTWGTPASSIQPCSVWPTSHRLLTTCWHGSTLKHVSRHTCSSSTLSNRLFAAFISCVFVPVSHLQVMSLASVWCAPCKTTLPKCLQILEMSLSPSVCSMNSKVSKIFLKALPPLWVLLLYSN